MKRESGFTLIELLLVLAIIGIISAIAIPALLGQRERAKAKSTQENAVAIAGECARLNDTMREAGTAISPSAIASSVCALSSYAVVKNPYSGAAGVYTAAASTSPGMVYLSGGTTVDNATGLSYNSVTIVGHYLVGGVDTTILKVVALD